ncbi:MAG TPA: cation-translocating P-type ATPase [Phnomibacter sp.]|nr:cation-translocating P-type ATPase [Phnomibacter sp.]
MDQPHLQTPESLLESIGSSHEGLSHEEAAARLATHGHNELQQKKKVPAWRIFVRQFGDLMIIILIAAAIISGFLEGITDTIIILVIIILNAVVGFMQEYRAEKALEALRKMSQTRSQVLRGGEPSMMASSQIVPGDIVVLEAGNLVPADMRLVEAHGFRVDEASLTGESMPVDKHTRLLPEPDLPLGDRRNMAYKGTQVTGGRAKGLVMATGMQTELGKIAGMLQGKEPMTPLQQRMARFGKNLSYIILLICAILFVTGVMRGEDPYKILLLSVSLAVAAIPEALPALITIALARGAARLARNHALVRKLPAVETLGSVTYICSDKTGTITQNKMRVVELHDANGIDGTTGIPLLHVCMALNHDVKQAANGEWIGEPTEVALIEKMIAMHSREKLTELQEKFPRVAEVPFDSERRCMTTIHNYGGGYLIITKGASESVAGFLSNTGQAGRLRRFADDWAHKGIRVLAYACRIAQSLPDVSHAALVEANLLVVGIAGLMDPARDEIKHAIQECRTAGIKPVMITGDHPATAMAIASEIGIMGEGDLELTGAQLAKMSDDEFEAKVERTAVYARVAPEQKLRIVKALQRRGHFVSMTGDGVNDAPSLRAANIGVAMGITGTDVSKEAAHLILLDDNFTTIIKAVKEGRRIYDNIRRFIKYIMTCNGAEIWTIFMAPLMGMPIPLLPVHILWINLVTDGLPALTLANEPPEPDVMKRPPRPPRESLFADGVGYHIVWVGILMAGVTLFTQAWALHNDIVHWQTLVFTVLSVSQLGHVMAVRSDRTFLYKQGIFTNKPLLLTVFFTFLLQMAVVYLPFMNVIFRTAPLTAGQLLFCLAMALVVFHAVEAEKWVKMKIRARQAAKGTDTAEVDDML